MTMERTYEIHSVGGPKNPKPDYRKNCFKLYMEDGLHGVVRQVRNENTVTVEDYLEDIKFEPSYLALVDDREDLKNINSMDDLKYDPYMYMPGAEYIFGERGGLWDWEAKEAKVITIDIHGDDVPLTMIRVTPQIGMPSREEFMKWCLDLVWECDLSKSQAIVHYYHTNRRMSFVNIARCMRKSPQNVNSMYRVAEEKRKRAEEEQYKRERS